MSATQPAPSISVVVPVYGCAACLGELCRRVSASVETITRSYEIILVDDRSPDDSWSRIEDLRQSFPQIYGVRLSRNFGQHIAITAGLAAARGDLVVVMDCDLQDPPEKIPELYARHLEGFEMVLARRSERNHSAFRTTGAKLYFWLMSKLSEEKIDGSYGTFSMLSRKVVTGFLRFGERERHYLFILRWLGFSQGTIEYAHEARAVGASSYSFGRLVRHALDGMFFQATVLLRWIVLAGLTMAALGGLTAAYLTFRYFTRGSVEGWTSVVVLMLVCTGMLQASLGVIGLYIGKIFDQTKGRPLYAIDRTTGDEAKW